MKNLCTYAKKHKKLIILGSFAVILAISVPFIIQVFIYRSNPDGYFSIIDNPWLGFFGAYLGAIIGAITALIMVTKTNSIQRENTKKLLKQEWDQFELSMGEQKRQFELSMSVQKWQFNVQRKLNVRPRLSIQDISPSDVQNRSESPTSFIAKEFIVLGGDIDSVKGRTLRTNYIGIILRNIGLGSVVGMRLIAQTGDKTVVFQNIGDIEKGFEKELIFNLSVNSAIVGSDNNEIKIKLEYKDILENGYTQYFDIYIDVQKGLSNREKVTTLSKISRVITHSPFESAQGGSEATIATRAFGQGKRYEPDPHMGNSDA